MITTPIVPTRVDSATPTSAAIEESRVLLLDELGILRQTIVDADAAIDALAAGDIDDAGDAVEMHARTRARALAVAADVESALARIADGTYGVCEQCRDTILPARLAAIPYARTCVSCSAR